MENVQLFSWQEILTTAARVARRDRRARGVKLFRFTQEEENRIDEAIRTSERFMESYGQGRVPEAVVYNRNKYI